MKERRLPFIIIIAIFLFLGIPQIHVKAYETYSCGTYYFEYEMVGDNIMITDLCYPLSNQGGAGVDSIEIPSSIKGHTVTTIADEAFDHCSASSIILPDGLVTIGDKAFNNCYNLKSIIIPDSVTSIGEWAFYSCDDLTSCKISNKITSIKEYTFAFCNSLKEINIPSSVTSIGDHAFYCCHSLDSIVLTNGLVTIGNYAFTGCDNAKSITIPNSVTSIGKEALGFTPNPMISVNDYIDGFTIYGSKGSAAESYMQIVS